MIPLPSPEEIRRLKEHIRALEASGVPKLARDARRKLAEIFPDGVPDLREQARLAREALEHLTGSRGRDTSPAGPRDPRLEQLQAMIAARLPGDRSEQARKTVMRVAEQVFSDTKEWLSLSDISKLGLSKDTLYSALRGKPGSFGGGQASGKPLRFKRLAVLDYVVSVWKPKRTRKSV